MPYNAGGSTSQSGSPGVRSAFNAASWASTPYLMKKPPVPCTAKLGPGASMLAAAPGPSFAVHGTGGFFIKYGVDAQEAALKADRTPGEPDWDVDPPALYGMLTTPEGTRAVPTIPSSYAHYYENVRDAILGKAELAVTPQQALDVMRGLELAV